MISCPHCNATIPADLDTTRCAVCARPLVPGESAQPDRWDALRWSVPPPPTAAARESVRPAHAATSVDLLKSLLAIATARAGAEPAGGSATESSKSVEYVTPADVRSLPAHADGTIAAALDSLRDRVRLHQRGVASVVDLMTMIANADGEIDQAETEAVTSALGVLLGGNPKRGTARLLIQSSLAEIRASGGETRVREIAQVLTECGAAEQGVIAATAIAYASYGLSAVERAFIEQLGKSAGLTFERTDSLIRMVRAEVDPA